MGSGVWEYRLGLPLMAALLLLAPVASAVVEIDWVTVGSPGNACDPQSNGCWGAVEYSYRISRYEVTNAQYTEFLNAVAATYDTHGLYHPFMGPDFGPATGGIERSGSSGSRSYSTIAGREDWPVNFVSWYSALRFANWLHNGQPTGAQDSTTTEDGAYAIHSVGAADSASARKSDAEVFLSSEDEWYKAAYYDAPTEGYFDYPLGTDLSPACAAPGATAQIANCGRVVDQPTAVGSYSQSVSPNGTFDQGGNVSEWMETTPAIGGTRWARGGAFTSAAEGLAGSSRGSIDQAVWEFESLGFRVAAVPGPEPVASVPSLGLLGMALFCSVLCTAGLRGLCTS